MFGPSILEIAIGIVFIYLIVSITCTAVNEGISTILNQRGRNLFNGIKNLLNDPMFTGLAQQVYHHGLVDGITRNKRPNSFGRRPSYMSPKTFSLALLDILGSQGAIPAVTNTQINDAEKVVEELSKNLLDPQITDADKKTALDAANVQISDLQKSVSVSPDIAAVKMLRARLDALVCGTDPRNADSATKASKSLEEVLAAGREIAGQLAQSLSSVEEGISRLPNGHTKESLLVFIDKAKRGGSNTIDQIEQFKADIETWFNDAMDRVSGWYKRWTQIIVLLISIIIVCMLNVDSIMLIDRLSSDKDFRAVIFENAKKATDGNKKDSTKSDDEIAAALASIQTQIVPFSNPLGWSSDSRDPRAFPRDFGNLLMKFLGLLISIGAVSLGAPFWFDILSKFINIRGSGVPPIKSPSSA